MSSIDVIVLDLDGGAMLDACLASIAGQSVRPDRVIVFDNGSRVPAATRLAAQDVVVMRSETNLGFAGGANAALRQSAADCVALVNNDVVLDREWLASVRNALERDERLAAAQTIIRRPDGRVDGAGIDVSDGTFRQIGHGVELGTPLPVAWGVSATATLYRRSAIGDAFFDEELFAYYEDVALSARLRNSGWRVSVLPLVYATHRGSMSADRLGGRALRLRTRNRYLVARRYRVGSIVSLLWEDMKLLLRGRSSMAGIVEGLTSDIVRQRRPSP